jgi:hypothetical protein
MSLRLWVEVQEVPRPVANSFRVIVQRIRWIGKRNSL